MLAGGRHRRNWKKYSSSGTRSHKSNQRVVKRSILFTFVERWNVCQEVIGPLAVFHFPSSFSLFEIEDHAALSSCVRVSWKEGSIQKGKNGTPFSFLLLHAVFRLPDFATGHSSIALLPFLVCLHSTILSFHGPDLHSCYYLSFFNSLFFMCVTFNRNYVLMFR